MEITEVKTWIQGKWVITNDKENYMDKSREVIERLLNSEEVAICSYYTENKIKTKAMYIVKKSSELELWFNSDSTAELTQLIEGQMDCTIYVYNKENVEGVMLEGSLNIERDSAIRAKMWKAEFEDWYIGGIRSEDYQVIRFVADKCVIFTDGMQIKMRK